MTRLAVAGSLALVVFVAACADEQGVAPEAVVAPQFSYSHSGSCRADDAKEAARRFFKSKKDPIFDLLSRQWKAYRDGSEKGARHFGFEALQEIAEARGTSRQAGDGEDGNALTRAIIGCMSLGSLPSGFSVAAALEHGVFEVRGGAGDDMGPALAMIAGPSSSSAPPTIWGVEASNGWDATYRKKDTRYLVYGAPRPVNSFTVEPASVDPDDVAYTGFDIFTFPATPALKFGAPLRIGICIDPQSGNVSNRILHREGDSEVVLALSPLTFCDDALAAIESRDRSVYRLLARKAFSFLAPPEAHAWFLGGVGGLASALSPLGPVAVDITQGELQFALQPTPEGVKKPAQIRAGSAFPVVMRVTTANGTPVEGVRVTLSIDRNKGVPAGAVLQGVTTGITDQNGEVSFSVSIPKPGGYTLVAVPTLGGVDGPGVMSGLFTVKK